MTNYNDWDSKAKALCKEAEEEDKKEKEAADKALGLEDGPQGPPVAKAKEQRMEMGGHSVGRKNFIAEQQAKEMVLEHSTPSEEPIVVADADGRALRLRGSCGVTYELSESQVLLKLFVSGCKNVKILVRSPVKSSFLEIDNCSDVEIRTVHPLATVQCDECVEGPVKVIYQEPEHVGNFVHQNSPALQVEVPGRDVQALGEAGQTQWFSMPTPDGAFRTEAVRRGEKEYPLNAINSAGGKKDTEPDAEQPPSSEMLREKAEARRAEGNNAFKASDFLQAAVYYTEAIEICEDMSLAWANRAQCFLKTGQPEKALIDATKCTELAPEYAKGWFRKGMALHALQRYGAAVPALVEAEKLDPKNAQIPDAIRMAQMMCRKHGPGDS